MKTKLIFFLLAGIFFPAGSFSAVSAMTSAPRLNQDIVDDKEALSDLFENPLVHIRDLRVRTVNGVRTLQGLASREEDRKRAWKIVAAIRGVSEVNNRIEVL